MLCLLEFESCMLFLYFTMTEVIFPTNTLNTLKPGIKKYKEIINEGLDWHIFSIRYYAA